MAIAIGVVMMLLSIASGLGLQKKIREKISGFNGHIIISPYDENQSQISTVPLKTSEDFYTNLRQISGIQHLQGVATKTGIIRTENTFEGILFKGVDSTYQWSTIAEYLTEGRLPNTKSILNNEVVLSEYLANRLELKTGDTFSTYFMKNTGNKIPNLRVFKLVGIYNSGFEEFDSSLLIGDIRHIRRMNKWQNHEIGTLEIFISDFNEIESKGQEIYTAIPAELDAKTIKEKYASIFELLSLFDFNIIVIISIMILVATINMVVALLVLILERTQMIGILKALGTSNWSIRKIFLYNATYLIGKGLLYGNTIGIGMILIQNYFGIIKLDPKDYYVNEAQVHIEWWHILALNGGTVAVCLIVLLIPSYLVSKISPSSAMRFH